MCVFMLGLPRCQTKKNKPADIRHYFSLKDERKLAILMTWKPKHTQSKCVVAPKQSRWMEKSDDHAYCSCETKRRPTLTVQSMSKNFHHYLIFFSSFPFTKTKLLAVAIKMLSLLMKCDRSKRSWWQKILSFSFSYISHSQIENEQKQQTWS